VAGRVSNGTAAGITAERAEYGPVVSKQNQSDHRRFASRGDAMLRSRILRIDVLNRAVRAFPMTSRIRFLITAAFVCHLLLAPSLVTSQFLSFAGPSDPAASGNISSLQYQDVTWSATSQELDGPMVKLHGNAELHYGTYILYGDEISYNRDTGDSTADGHVVLDGGPDDEHIKASRGAYNIRSESGRFEIVTGTTGMRLKSARLILTSPNPFAFTGKVVVKTGPGHFLVYDGTITTCELPRPKWQFYAHEVDVQVGGNAKIYNSTFRLEGIPILFFPFATHPIQKRPRQSGFLIPNAGRSSIKGYIVGESVFWAINPSMDALLGAEYFSKRGWAPQGEFRAQPSDTSFVDLNFFSVLDRLQGADYQGGADVRLTAEGNFHNFRAVANIDYLSSYVFRLAFSDVFAQAVNSEVNSTAFLSNATRGFFYNASMQRYQDYESANNDDVVAILHAPSFSSASVDHAVGHSPFYWSYEAAMDGLERSDPPLNTTIPNFSTAGMVGRFDLNPSISLPLQFHGWSIRPELSLRDTFYTKRLLTSPIGIESTLSDAINRKALEGSVEIRPPTLDRVFDRQFLGRKWKHVIEPRVVYNYVTGVNNFSRTLRFDERDILSDTNEVEYSVVNRLYSKRTTQQPDDCGPLGMPTLLVGGAPPQNRIPWQRYEPTKDNLCREQPQVREVVRWEVAQKYFLDPTFGGALIQGQPNVFASTIDLTGIAFLTEARRLSPLISRLRIQTSSRTDVEWDVDYDLKSGIINNSTALLNYRIGQFTLGGGNAFLHILSATLPSGVTPPTVPTTPSFNQFRAVFGYGQVNKRGFSAAANLGFDGGTGSLQYSSIQASYNWDCCGFSTEYRRFNLGTVRDENQVRFTFALANIGSFGNLRRQERLY
jgi:LPS-assembly protein